MKPGTPGFNGARLREAREARGLPAIALADLIGVTRAAVSQYENSVQTPRPEVMEKIARTLQLPQEYFRRPISRIERGAIFYRSMSAATKAARARAECRYSWLREIVTYLREFVQFPPMNIPDFNLPDDPVRISYNQIEELATQSRQFWKIGEGPIGNVVRLLENNGIVVVRDELGAETLDAFSEFNAEDGTPYIILGSDKAVAVRSRFDAAHELGHLILHRNINKNRLSRPTDHQLIETQAHRFAGAFLLPGQAFASEFYSANLDALRILKPKWKVSIAMMVKRAEDLEFISSEQAKRLWINYSRRRWRAKEPLDGELEVEQPRLLVRAFELLLNEGIQTCEQILSHLPLNPNDIEALATLSGQLTKTSADEPSVRVLDLTGRTRQKSQHQIDKPGQVIQFAARKPHPTG
ncbi:MAG: ImmA/IrrE family metallo-endopeptidase [Candidatus Methylomirabilis oxygeniifera]|uniref:HTH cro/C1-type domain-containing protein n=1 Tax=Methylomirabilis oxygeniifera TaxID=671143 RepID=D5MF68_METO1|nr:MAG: ImmA/IrrE family metallo-endopeptidase [Candidatus Methylomirabilis oxyfera]CBE68397.1 conserved protein of unknown function [Candidatus Methylomirabilis oxyfera]